MTKVLTRDDLLRAGACESGVRDWCEQFAPMRTAMSVASLLRLATGEARRWILRAAGLDGYGDGYGYGA